MSIVPLANKEEEDLYVKIALCKWGALKDLPTERWPVDSTLLFGHHIFVGLSSEMHFINSNERVDCQTKFDEHTHVITC